MGIFLEYLSIRDKIKKTLNKIPTKHEQLVSDYSVKFVSNHCLDKNGNVGEINLSGSKVIKLSSPWIYGREFVFLHEVAHLVYNNFIKNTKWENEWSKIYKINEKLKKQYSKEESFCMCYASFFSDNFVDEFKCDSWDNFMERFCFNEE